MIRYDLLCDKDHSFDSWFSGSDSFDTQARRGFVVCPHCGSAKVRKALMAPKIAGTRTQDAPGAGAGTDTAPLAAAGPKDRELRAMLRAMHEHLKQHSDDVGDKFAEEARKMHYGEADHRSIHGQANIEEARALYEEGIEFHALPVLPDDHN